MPPESRNERGVRAAYCLHCSPNALSASLSSVLARRAYMKHSTGNIASVKRVGHCRRKPNMIITKPTYCGCRMRA